MLYLNNVKNVLINKRKVNIYKDGFLFSIAAHMSFDNPFVRPPEMMFGLIKGGKLCNVKTHNINWANQNSVSLASPKVIFGVTCFPVYVKASVIISSILLISKLTEKN